MHLKSLELSGFKSFGKKAELHFTSAITSIVGPNGSGKSNVAEAFRFVLGEQSMKTLRGKKGEDMIWNGSNTVPRGNRASAMITFDNRSRFLQMDFDTVTIERIVHRDGVNEYKINGTNVRLRDVTELLAGANIGASGHHIISQGEADRILSSNPKERREMIEDGLGLRIYQYKKRESERKLEKTEENKQQVEALRRENAPHLKFLLKQMERLKKAEALREALGQKYIEYLKREDLYLTYESEKLHADKKPLLDAQSRLEIELAAARDTLAHSDKEDTRNGETLAFERELTDIRRVRDTLAREIGRIEGEIRVEKRRIQGIQEADGRPIPWGLASKMVQDLTNEFLEVEKNDDIHAVRIFLKGARERLQQFVERFKGEPKVTQLESVDTLEATLKDLNKKEADLVQKEREISARMDTYRNQQSESREKGRKAEREIFRILSEQGELRVKINDLKSRTERINTQQEDFKRQVGEGIALIGRQVASYRDVALSVEQIIEEDRGVQEERRRELEKMKIRLEESGGGGGEEIAKEFNEAQKRDEYLQRELADLEKSAESLRGVINELSERLDREFREGVEKISLEFNRFFGLMFGSGVAKLVLVLPPKKKKKDLLGDDMDEDAELGEGEVQDMREGVDVSVMLPHKRIKGLEMLSGGERALTSIALIFAMSQVNPPPFLILDETDAALDEANSRRYGDMISNLATKSQLILITHNRETMGRAGVLYGVTMGADGISKLLSIQFEEAVKVAK